jgi:tetratricopeptide (TPR) repeat protein
MINHTLHISITMLAAFLFSSGALGQGTIDTVQVYSAGQVITKAFVKMNDDWVAHPCTIGQNIFIVGTAEISTPNFGTLIKSQFIVEVDGVPRPLLLEKKQLSALSPFSANSFRELLKAKSTIQRSADAIEGELITQEYIVQSANAVKVPHAVAILRKPLLNQAWLSIQDAKNISADRMKRGESGIPDPYFAEALLWKTLGRHEDSLASFLIGSSIAIKNGQNLTDHIEYYREFNQYLEDYLQSPLPKADPTTERDAVFVARRYFARGISSYKEGNPSKAIEYFTEAILLNPNRAAYWHYRALCFRAQQFTQRATHDITIGIAIERRFNQRSSVYAALTSAQGPDRLWLETYRNRQNIPILVKANDPNTTR